MDDRAPAQDRGAAEMAAGEIASLLERRLGARGDSLGQRLERAGEAVPPDIAAKIRYIEACRKELNEHDDTVLADRGAFDRSTDEVIRFLSGPIQPVRRETGPWRQGMPLRQVVAFGLLGVAMLLIAVAVWGISRTS